MTAQSYARLAAVLFALIAVLQFIPVGGWGDSGERDDVGSSVGKLDCLHHCCWARVDWFQRITPIAPARPVECQIGKHSSFYKQASSCLWRWSHLCFGRCSSL